MKLSRIIIRILSNPIDPRSRNDITRKRIRNNRVNDIIPHNSKAVIIKDFYQYVQQGGMYD